MNSCQQLQNHQNRFDVKEIKSDDEPGILALRGELGKIGIVVNTGTRSSKNTCTPYQLPPVLVKHLIKYVTSRMNCMSSTSALSPFELLTGRKLSYKRDLRISFGSFVQLDDPDATNNLDQRRISALALYPELDQTGNNWFYPLRDTHAVPIKRSSWIETPITDSVIHYINKMSIKSRIETVITSLGSPNPEDEQIINELFDDRRSYIRSLNNISTSPPNQPIQQTADESHHAPNVTTTAPPTISSIISAPTRPFAATSASNVRQAAAVSPAPPIIAPPTPQPVIPTQHIERNEGGDDTTIETTSTITATPPTPSFNPLPPPSSITTASTETAHETTQVSADIPQVITDAIDDANTNQFQVLRRSPRSNAGNWYKGNKSGNKCRNYHLTVKDFIKMDERKAKAAIIDELKQMKKLEVYEPVTPNTVLDNDADLIPANCINKIKKDSKGNIIKWKSRLVAAGNWQTERTIFDTSSPTIHLSSLYTLLNIALYKNMKIITADIVGAYLNANMDKNIYMQINKNLVPYLIEADNKMKGYVNNNGKIILKLKKAIYGCRQSGRLWYDKITSILTSLNFTKSIHDECIFQSGKGDNHIIIGLYVDDLIIISSNNSIQNNFINKLKKKVYGITINDGVDQEYLGMHRKIKLHLQ